MRKAFMSLIVLMFFIAEMGAQSQTLPPGESGALAQLNASPRHGEWVTIEGNSGDKLDLWVVYPERKDKAPVVLVIHEIFGLNSWAQAVADQFAAEGFIAIAPDFLSGKGPGGKGSASIPMDQSRVLMGALDQQEIGKRLDAAAYYGRNFPASTGAYGIVGFCWGGGLSFSYATHQPELKATVVYYGTSPRIESLGRIQAPVLGLYGGNDARVNATVGPAQEEMKRLGKTFEVEIFEGAGHAFLRQQGSQNPANLKASQTAWPRTINFLRRYLEEIKATDDFSEGSARFSMDNCDEEVCSPQEKTEAALTLPVE